MVFSVAAGSGDARPAIDSLTAADGIARADFLSPRQPETDRVRAVAAGLTGRPRSRRPRSWIPNAAGGTLTNYPNPFHPPPEATTHRLQAGRRRDGDAAASSR